MRRKGLFIEDMNNKLVELAKNDIYEKAAPMLLGDQFAKEVKERTNCGPWTGLRTAAHTFKDSRISELLPSQFMLRGWHKPKPLQLPVWSSKGTLPTIPI